MKVARLVVLGTILTISACTQCLWYNYQATAYDPCKEAGERMGLTDIHEHARAGSNYGARCSGVRNGRYVQYRAR